MKDTPQKSFRVDEVAKLVGISPSTLRLWESHRLVSPSRSEGGHRIYKESDVERARQINRMRKVQSLNLAAIKAVLSTEDGGGAPSRHSGLGQKLKEMRRGAKLTLKEVSARTGLPISLISTLERTSAGASMVSLMALANCYGAPITDLLAPPQEQAKRVVRCSQARRLPILGPLITIEQLAEGPVQMDCQRWILQPGAASEGSYSHEGEEFIHVLSGEFEIALGSDELHRLKAGDSIYFPSTISHAWRNSGAEPVILIWVSTPRTF